MSDSSGSLVPQEPGPLDVVPKEADYLLQDEAQSWRIDLRNLSYLHQKIWSEQERFLAGYRAGGTIKAGLVNVTVVRRTVELWKQNNLLRFSERLSAAHETFCDSQEQILYTLNEGLKPGQVPTGLLATLNSNRPLKWRPNIAVTHGADTELIKALRGVQQEARELREARVVDGQVVEEQKLPWEIERSR